MKCNSGLRNGARAAPCECTQHSRLMSTNGACQRRWAFKNAKSARLDEDATVESFVINRGVLIHCDVGMITARSRVRCRCRELHLILQRAFGRLSTDLRLSSVKSDVLHLERNQTTPGMNRFVVCIF